MEAISLTNGQMRILLNSTDQPEKYPPRISSLVAALHKVRINGHMWCTEMTEEDIETALDLFNTYQREVGSPGAKQAWQFFVRDNPTARRFYDEHRSQGDVPRETSTEGTP